MKTYGEKQERENLVQFGGANGGGRCLFASPGALGPPPSLTFPFDCIFMSNLGKVLIALALSCLMGGCHTQSGSRQSGEAERRAIKLAVLAYMVEHLGCDPAGKLVRYVELQPSEVRQLRHLCGHRFQIAPLSPSERAAGCLTLSDSIKKGFLLKVMVQSVNGSQAEVSGDYNRGPGSWATSDYTLRKEKGTWRVTSKRTYFPS